MIEQLVRTKSYAREQYQKSIAKLIDYYRGNQLVYLDELLKNQFVKSANLKQQPQVCNIVKPLIKQSAKVFQEGVNVQFENPDQADIFKAVVPGLQMSLVTIDRMVQLLKTAPVKVSFRRGQIKLDVMPGNIMAVEQSQDDYLEVDKVKYARDLVDTTSPNKQETIYHYWTNTQYWRTTGDGTRLKFGDGPDAGRAVTTNNYGIIPFVFFREEIDPQLFWNYPDDTLISAQDNINIKLTELNYLFKMQGFSVWVAIDYKVKGRKTLDPSEVIEIETVRSDKADLKAVTPDAKMEELIRAIGEEFIRAAWHYGISPSQFTLQGEVKSGFALEMENVTLSDDIQNRKNIYTPLLGELYDLIRRVWNYHTQYSEDMLIPDLQNKQLTEMPQFDIKELRQPMNPQEEQALWQFYLDNGLRDKADYEMYKNPDLTREEAIDLVKQRVAEGEQNPEITPGPAQQSQIVSGLFE